VTIWRESENKTSELSLRAPGMRRMITRRRFVLAAFLLLAAGVAVVDYWSIAANAATSPAISSNAMATDVTPSDHHGTQWSASTASLLPARPMSKKDWKRYIASKYRQVIESKLRFDLVDLYTPRRVFDDDDATILLRTRIIWKTRRAASTHSIDNGNRCEQKRLRGGSNSTRTGCRGQRKLARMRREQTEAARAQGQSPSLRKRGCPKTHADWQSSSDEKPAGECAEDLQS
jgi:hypothetical protein